MTGAAPHVLLTADAVGGVWTYALALARGLVNRRVDVTLAVLGPPAEPDQLRQAGDIEGLRIETIGGPLDWTAPDEAALRPVATALSSLVDRIGADLVHLSTPALAGLTAFAAPIVGACHSCEATWRAASATGSTKNDGTDWRFRLLASGYAACRVLLAPSHAFAAATAALYGVHARVVFNGRDADEAAEGPKERIALTAGRLWDAGKDVATLERAATEFELPLIALGALGHPAGGVVMVKSVHALGRVAPTEVSAWMQRAGVFVSAARYEPFGLAVLEAAHARCALVLSDIPTFRELWDGAATFVTVGDAEGFARECRRLLDDPCTQQRAGDAARRRARRYSTEVQTGAMLEIYGEVAPRAFGALAHGVAA